MAQCAEYGHCPPGRVPHQHRFFDAERIEQRDREIRLCLGSVWRAARPLIGSPHLTEHALREAESRPIERDHRATFTEWLDNLAPRERACAEPVEQHDGGTAGTGGRVVHGDPSDLDEAGVRRGELRRFDRTIERCYPHQQGYDEHGGGRRAATTVRVMRSQRGTSPPRGTHGVYVPKGYAKGPGDVAKAL